MNIDLLENILDSEKKIKNYFSNEFINSDYKTNNLKDLKYFSPAEFLKNTIRSPILDKKYSGNPNDLKVDRTDHFQDTNRALISNYGINLKKSYELKGPLIIK